MVTPELYWKVLIEIPSTKVFLIIIFFYFILERRACHSKKEHLQRLVVLRFY